MRFGIVLLALVVAGCGKQPESPAASHPAFRARVLCVGKSMLPTYGESEWVEVEFCHYEDLRGGDTVIRWDPVLRIFVHHRLEFRNETGKWQTRGDNNGGSDRGVMTPDEFVGRTHKL
jgi:hypothetical protein